MNAETLELAGRALFGEFWQHALAEALGITARTVRYWASGRADIPPDVSRELFQLVNDRHGVLLDAHARLRALIS